MLTIGDYKVDETKIAQPVVERLLTRAVAHILNNECSANVLGKTKRAIVGKDGKPDSVNETMLETWRTVPANVETIAAWEREFCEAKIAAMYDGTLSVRVSRGPSKDPIEAVCRMIAAQEIFGVLKVNGIGFLKGSKTLKDDDTLYELADGAEPVSGEALIDRRLAREDHGPRIRALAERKVREDARLRDATAKAVAGEGGLAGLGL